MAQDRRPMRAAAPAWESSAWLSPRAFIRRHPRSTRHPEPLLRHRRIVPRQHPRRILPRRLPRLSRQRALLLRPPRRRLVLLPQPSRQQVLQPQHHPLLSRRQPPLVSQTPPGPDFTGERSSLTMIIKRRPPLPLNRQSTSVVSDRAHPQQYPRLQSPSTRPRRRPPPSRQRPLPTTPRSRTSTRVA
jgi:hypothetical protein